MTSIGWFGTAPSTALIISFQVSKERGEELAIEYGIKFMETSAKASINVEEAFFTLARDIKAKMEKRLVRSPTPIFGHIFFSSFSGRRGIFFFREFEFRHFKRTSSGVSFWPLNVNWNSNTVLFSLLILLLLLKKHSWQFIAGKCCYCISSIHTHT